MKKAKSKDFHEAPWGPAFNNKPFLQIPIGGIGIIVKCGFSVTDAVILSELIGLSYKNGPNNVLAPATSLGDRCGLTRQTAARALSKAIKMKLIIVVKEYSVIKNTARQYDIRPFLEKLQSDFLKEKTEVIEIEESKEITENKHPNSFGKAAYEPITDFDDLPDEATRGWKNCKKCRVFGPNPCDCEEHDLPNLG